jgi:hypothetical protein
MRESSLFFSSRLFAHRGLWSNSLKPNSIKALAEAKNRGFSAETDLRIYRGEIYLAHDPSDVEFAPKLKDIDFENFKLALNLKEDGLLSTLTPHLELFQENRSFVFDGSIPQMYQINKAGFPHAMRMSEFERDLPWNSGIIWLDSFTSDWWLNDEKILHFFEKFRVIVVSPELHRRDPLKSWERLRSISEQGLEFEVCTDKPNQFMDFING